MAKKTVKFENKKGKVNEIVVNYRSEGNYFDEMGTIGMKSANRRIEMENGSKKNKESYAVQISVMAVILFLAIVLLPAKIMTIVFTSVVILLAGFVLGKFLFNVVTTTISNMVYTHQLKEYNEWKMETGKESL